MEKKLVPALFLSKKIKTKWTSGYVPNFIQLAFLVFPSQGLPKYINTKVLTTCFYQM